jgi:hypothetical protein
MSSFEWMELQTLTSDITAARSRLVEARASSDRTAARALEKEISVAEARRLDLLAHITTDLVGAGRDDAAHRDAEDGCDPADLVLVEEIARGDNDCERGAREPADRIGDSAASLGAAPQSDSTEGGVVVWNQLTASDVQHAKAEVSVRRAEMLARHAEELKGLDEDQSELDTLTEAVTAFMHKFKPSSDDSAVVVLGHGRELRHHRSG